MLVGPKVGRQALNLEAGVRYPDEQKASSVRIRMGLSVNDWMDYI